MKKRRADRANRLQLTVRQRVPFASFGLLILGWGVGTLVARRLHYPNWFGEPVFAPFAVFIGALLVLLALRPNKKD